MAGDWLMVQANLSRKAEVIRMAKILDISRHAVAGAVVEVWGWAQEQSVDGRVDAHVDGIELMIGAHPGLLRAMVQVGWLEDHDAYVTFPKWDRWLSNGAKARLQKSLRQKEWRDRKQNVDAGVDGHVDGHVDADVAQKRLPQKRREENNINGAAPPLTPSARKASKIQNPATIMPPTLEAVIAHGVTIMLPDDQCQQFMDHYTANGWKVGRNPMRNWKSAMQNWLRNFRAGIYTKGSHNGNGTNNGHPQSAADARRAGKAAREFAEDLTLIPTFGNREPGADNSGMGS